MSSSNLSTSKIPRLSTVPHWILRLQRVAFGMLVVSSVTVACSVQADAPLAEALMRRDHSTAKVFLDQQQAINAAQPDGMTPLHWAVYHDDTSITKQLLAAGASVDETNRFGVTALSIACTNGNHDIVRMLLEAGADPNAKLRGGETVLMTAARTGKLGPVSELISRGAKVNTKERRGQTALMWAAAEGHHEVVDALLKAEADFRTPLNSGFTPYFFAVRAGKSDVVRHLLEAGIDVNAAMQPKKWYPKTPPKGTSALILAVENGHFQLAAELLEAGADPNDQRCGFSALHAITWVRKPIRGDGDPPPLGSGKLSSLQLVEKLVEHGADVNLPHKPKKRGAGRINLAGASPFLLAAVTGDIPLMNLLLKLGADPLLPNADNCTPLLAAAGADDLSSGDQPAGTEAEAIEAVTMLLKLGADVNAVDDNGETAMHGAAYKNSPKLIHLLVQNGADQQVWDSKNKYGWTPLAIAKGHRHGNFRPSQETIEALLDVMEKTGDSSEN